VKEMKYPRKMLEEIQEIAHDLKHIKLLEIKEARMRTKKRKLFYDMMERIDTIFSEESKKVRKDDTR